MKKKELLERRNALKGELDALLKKFEASNETVPSKEEWAGYEAKEAELAKVNEDLASIEKLEEKAKENAKRDYGTGARVVDLAGQRPWESFGALCQAVIRAHSPVGAFTGAGEFDPRLQLLAPTGANEAVGADGGFLVGTEMSNQIFSKVFTEGQILSRVFRWPVGPAFNGIKVPYLKESARTAGNRYGGIRTYRKAEAATVTASRPTFQEFKMELETGMALVYLTDELMADAMQLDSYVSRLVPRAITFDIEEEIINGNGVGKSLGILNAPALVSVSKETGQLAATVVYENIVKMWARLHGPSQTNAVWLINQDIIPQLFLLNLGVGTAGAPVFLPPGGASVAPFGTIFGRPIIPTEHNPTLGTVGDIILADLGEYWLIEKGGVNAASSIHVQFIYGETVLRFTYRNNGGPGPNWQAALTPNKGSNTQSPFVALATRA